MDKTPRYLQLANRLRRAIEGGDYAIGDLLPTEHELCSTHQISRHTARAALQQLEEVGLIERRRGAGTRVISAGQPPAFVQPLGGLDELMQYARDARLRITGSQQLAAPHADLSRVQIEQGQWIILTGIRYADGKPVAATSVYVIDQFGDRPSDYQDLPHAITEELRRRHGVTIGTITQSIHADQIGKADSGALNCPLASPCLKTVRYYRDTSGQLITVSESRHPADRFSYEMTYRRS